MTVITISRQYGSGGDEIAVRLSQMLGYRYFNKELMSRIATEVGLSPTEIVDFSEDNYEMRGFLERLFNWHSPHMVAHPGSWVEDARGAKTEKVADLDEAQSIAFIQNTIQAAYKQDNVVILGRGGQAILREMPDVLHVRIEAPLNVRDKRVHEQQHVSLAMAQDIVVNHDRAAADYLKRFYDIDWADSTYYDLVINTSKLSIEAAAHLIAEAVRYLPQAAE